MNTKYQKVFIVSVLFIILISWIGKASAFDEKIITVSANDPKGVVLKLPPGNYAAEVSGGAIALWGHGHPHYRWVYGLVVGTGVSGGTEEPNLGSLYVDPSPSAYTSGAAENAVLEAVKKGEEGTLLNFTLKTDSEVRFWVSDFDYSDNEGQEKVRIYSVVK